MLLEKEVVFLHTQHRPEAGLELLHLEEAHAKWKQTQQSYLGSLDMAGPAARAALNDLSPETSLLWGYWVSEESMHLFCRWQDSAPSLRGCHRH